MRIEHKALTARDLAIGKVNDLVLNILSSSFVFRIADIIYAIISVNPALKIEIQGVSKKFLAHEAIPDVTIEARWDNLSTVLVRGKKVFDSGAVWKLYNYNVNYYFTFTSSSLGPIPYKIAKVNKDFSRVEVLLHRPYFNPDQPIYPLEYPLDELLFINFLAFGKGVEVHACGIVDSYGNGHLFVGQSGAGKSTLAKLWQGEPNVTILSDDRIILRKMDNKIWMYGTPWHGEAGFASPDRAPLTKIYFLTHGLKNELIPLKATESIARFFSCSFVPFYNPEGIDFTLSFFEELVKTVPSYELKFIPNEQVVELIQTME